MLADTVHAVEELGTGLIRIAALAANMAKGAFAIPAPCKGAAGGKAIVGGVAASLPLPGVWRAGACAAVLAIGTRVARANPAIETLNRSAQGGDGHAVVGAHKIAFTGYHRTFGRAAWLALFAAHNVAAIHACVGGFVAIITRRALEATAWGSRGQVAVVAG
jgi:hypothetical protein